MASASPSSKTTGTTSEQLCYTLVAPQDSGDQPTPQELKNSFEKGSDDVKIATMKRLLNLMLSGEPSPGMLMHVIRFVMPSKNKSLKKLLYLYWELCPKYNPDGKLRNEMILVCNALRNDLQHPNEYIRGTALRFMSKLREAELLEPLLPSVRQCLEHRHLFVRKNAVFAIFSIHKFFEHLVPDAPTVIYEFLQKEADQTCKRNAFVMLCATDRSLVVDYLNTVFHEVPQMDELLQLAIIELIRKDCTGGSVNKAKYIRCTFELLNSPSHSVKYEAATTLVALVHSKTAVSAAAACYIMLILVVSDNNVKLIVLDRLADLHAKYASERLLEDLVMDVLRVLTSPDMDVRRKGLKIAMDMVSSRNVGEVVGFLKKELVKTVDGNLEKSAEYRQLLIQSIHSCAIKFSEVASSVVHVLMEFIGDSNNSSAVDVVAFVREVVEKFPDLCSGIIERLLATFKEMKSGKVFRGALWIVGEYATDERGIEEAWKQIRASLGEVPILAAEQRLLEAAQSEEPTLPTSPSAPPPALSKPIPKRTLADGTYATESAFSGTAGQKSSKLDAVKAAEKPPLRTLILNGDYYVGAVLATTLTKLVLRFTSLEEKSNAQHKKANAMRAEAMLMMTSLLRVGASQFSTIPIDQDSYDRILNCLRSLVSMTDTVKSVFLKDCKAAFSKMVVAEENKINEKKLKADKVVKVQADDGIVWRQFTKKTVGDDQNNYEIDLNRATGTADRGDDLISKLSRVVALTGFSDPVYAEAYVNVHQYDILMDVLIVNQTPETLQNLSIEFATLGDLKLAERPATHNLAGHSFHSVKVNIKVSSTETGVIFGNIVYDGPGAQDTTLVTLNDIHIDIMDYISPAYCNEQQFRSMWTEFEWENKVNVNTNITDAREYLNHIMKSTNMSCLTPETALSGDCGILSANMYARSIFGEDALANLSVERQADGPITGHIRIRSKTQGIALSLGDKITLAQKVQKK